MTIQTPDRFIALRPYRLLRLALVTLILTIVSPARGQGMFGLVPEPITSADLMAYAARLGLTDAQWPAAEAAHDEYKRQFQQFREGPLAGMMQKYAQMMSAEGMTAMEKIIADQQDLRATVAALDRRLFDALLPVLSEAQFPALERVRLQRERSRCLQSQMTMMLGRQTVDVSEVFLRADLPAADRAAADPLIAHYERQVTAVLREIEAMSGQAMLDLYRAMMPFESDMAQAAEDDDAEGGEDAGGEADEQAEVTRQQEMMQRMETAYTTAMAPMTAKMDDIAGLNRAAVRNVEQVLPRAAGRSFRLGYLQAAFAHFHFPVLNAQNWPARLRDAGDADEQTVAAVTAIVDDHIARADPVIDQLVAVLEKVNDDRMIFSARMNLDEDLMEEQQRLGQRLQEINDDAVRGLGNVLGPERSRRLLAGTDPHAEWQIAAMFDEAHDHAPQPDENAEAIVDDEMDEWTGDPFMPARLPRAQLDAYQRALGLDESQRLVLDTVYDDYADRYRQVRRTEIQAVTDLNSQFWRFDPQTNEMKPPDERMIPRITEARRKAFGAVHEADGAFFDQLVLAFADDDRRTALVQRFRNDRRRAALCPNDMWQYSMGYVAAREAAIDLLPLMDGVDGIDPDAALVAGILGEYRAASQPLFETRFERALEVAEAQLQLQAFYQRMAAEDGQVTDYMALYEKWQRQPQERLRTATRSIVDLNRATVQRLEAALDPAAAEALREAQRRATYPDIYSDEYALHDRLAAVDTLDDISDETRRAIGSLAVEYRNAYDECCRRLIDLAQRQQAIDMMDLQLMDDPEAQQSRMQDYLSMQQEQEREQFERNELNTRINRRLRSLLSPDQIRRIGGLPDPAEAARNPFGW